MIVMQIRNVELNLPSLFQEEYQEGQLNMLSSSSTVVKVAKVVILSSGGISVIVFTELVLKKNMVDLNGAPFTSTSQLLPFLIGLLTLVSTIWSILNRNKSEDES